MTRKRVLIVEDSRTQALMLQQLLEMRDYEVSAATNGAEALAMLETTAPELVITDINMPEMDGYELCLRIKKTPGLSRTPVILLTSLSDPKDILKGLECGADNFIVKPYDASSLLERIEHVFANCELRRQSHGKPATEIYFAGHKYRITAEALQSIDLLLSTYETAVQKNLELSEAKEKLEQQAHELRQKNSAMQADLEMARELQTAFLPRLYPVFPSEASPERSTIKFCHRYSTTSMLGGDFFDILPLGETQAAVFVCDVMGHGVRAALVTAIIRGLVEEFKEFAGDPARFLAELNGSLFAILRQTNTSLFASAFHLVLDGATGQLRFANAGHPMPFHVQRKLARAELLGQEKAGPVLGVFEATEYTVATRNVAAGDLIMLFTDGLFEIEDAAGEFYGQELLLGEVRRRTSLATPQLFDELLEHLRLTSHTHDFEDDMCLVGVDLGDP